MQSCSFKYPYSDVLSDNLYLLRDDSYNGSNVMYVVAVDIKKSSSVTRVEDDIENSRRRYHYRNENRRSKQSTGAITADSLA